MFMVGLALTGAYRRKTQLILLAAVLIFLLSIPLAIGMSGLITLICAACFCLSFFLSKLADQHLRQQG